MKLYKSILFGIAVCGSSTSFAQDPLVSYIQSGQAVPQWQAYVGNALNYFVPVENQQAKTPRGNLLVEPSSKDGNNDALRITWKGKKVKNQWGGNTLNDSFFALGKHKIDIAQVEDQAAIAIELKVNRSPSENVFISMQCKYSNKCSGKIPIKHQLKKLPEQEWSMLTLPLNCFSHKSTMDFSQVTNIVSISTQGKLDIEVANIGLVALPKGSKGCKS
ncbi:hypothetical protein DS2_14804 [Catenovulum agarivorans DS-2]|uniref:ExoP galactose-binding-like domain-containing protein n=1 Tax=Catenovulum agarivorans DS-2 TaxID=1328313 RepID=W7QLE6_9ALTE|nr:putative glycoside hydrolase [Catenovulum agarivorans]EWH08963.1 hypothetical protein DS2_14804 [Catenovulum agarivorans DS-2]